MCDILTIWDLILFCFTDFRNLTKKVNFLKSVMRFCEKVVYILLCLYPLVTKIFSALNRFKMYEPSAVD